MGSNPTGTATKNPRDPSVYKGSGGFRFPRKCDLPTICPHFRIVHRSVWCDSRHSCCRSVSPVACSVAPDWSIEEGPMSSETYRYPAAISRLSEGEMSRESQNARALRWLLDQPGGPVALVTPRKQVPGEVLSRFAARSGVAHLSWRGLSSQSLARRRVVYAWPDRQHLNDLYGVDVDALVVIEWNEHETADWIEDANPVQLLYSSTIQPSAHAGEPPASDILPNGVEAILRHIADMAAGYSSGLKWNEEDKLKADMMNRPQRWEPITVEQVRSKCCELGMRPNDVDTIAALVRRRKDGGRLNVRSSYRTFHFN